MSKIKSYYNEVKFPKYIKFSVTITDTFVRQFLEKITQLDYSLQSYSTNIWILKLSFKRVATKKFYYHKSLMSNSNSLSNHIWSSGRSQITLFHFFFTLWGSWFANMIWIEDLFILIFFSVLYCCTNYCLCGCWLKKVLQHILKCCPAGEIGE